jgi:transposase-like protein
MRGYTDPIFHDEDAARKHLEGIRWPDGVTCPLCGGTEKVKALGGASMGPGWYHCGDCRRKFTVRTGSVYERSHIPLHKWVFATHLLTASKKGISAHQVHRMIGVTYKSAWFMCHRIREAMIDTNPAPMGGEGQPVQVDETYFGTKDFVRGKPWAIKKGLSKKMAVVSLVSNGKSRTFHVDRADTASVLEIARKHIDAKAELHTDESPIYKRIGPEFAAHKKVIHAQNEYVRDGATTNNVENYFSVFKRGMKGVYQHCKEKHLQRYLNEFDFRYNARDINDFERAEKAFKGAPGKRLTYRRTNRAEA